MKTRQYRSNIVGIMILLFSTFASYFFTTRSRVVQFSLNRILDGNRQRNNGRNTVLKLGTAGNQLPMFAREFTSRENSFAEFLLRCLLKLRADGFTKSVVRYKNLSDNICVVLCYRFLP